MGVFLEGTDINIKLQAESWLEAQLLTTGKT